MNTKEILSEQYYAELIGYASSTLNLSLEEIKVKYADSPTCLMDYTDKGIHEKCIEIRFDKEMITLTCTFNTDGYCDSAFLFPDKNQLIEELVGYLTENHDYCFIRSRFILSTCYLKVKEPKESGNNLYLAFYR